MFLQMRWTGDRDDELTSEEKRQLYQMKDATKQVKSSVEERKRVVDTYSSPERKKTKKRVRE